MRKPYREPTPYHKLKGYAFPAWLGAFIVAAWAASILFMIGVGVYVSVIQ